MLEGSMVHAAPLYHFRNTGAIILDLPANGPPKDLEPSESASTLIRSQLSVVVRQFWERRFLVASEVGLSQNLRVRPTLATLNGKTDVAQRAARWPDPGPGINLTRNQGETPMDRREMP
jgi:hypothetical protein